MDGSLSTPLDQLVDNADADPAATLNHVEERLREPCDDLTSARCWHATGIARRSLGDLDGALAALATGIEFGRRVSDDTAGMIQLTRAAVLLMLGDVNGCRAELRDATEALAPEHELDGIIQSAAVEHRLGNLSDAAQSYRAASRLAAEQQRSREAARIHSNLGLLLTETGQFDEAAQHLELANQLYDELGLRDGAWFAEHNIGYLRLLEGDLVAALGHFDTVNSEARAAGAPAVANIDKSAALLAAGLTNDALHAAVDAVRELEHGDVTELSDALTSASRSALAAGKTEAAAGYASRALDVSRSLHRRGWEASIQSILLRAQIAHGAVTRDAALEQWDEMYRELVALGLEPLIHDVIVPAAEFAAANGTDYDVDAWMRLLDGHLPTSPADRAAWHHALALGHVRLGRSDQAAEHVELAVEAARRSTRWLGSIDMRVSAGKWLERSARLAAQLALDRDDVLAAIEWIDTALAASLELPGLRPPSDPLLRAACAELRAAHGALDAELAAGDDPDVFRRAVRRIGLAEARAADRLRLTSVNDEEAESVPYSMPLVERVPAGCTAVWLAVIGTKAFRFEVGNGAVSMVGIGENTTTRAAVETADRRFRSDVRRDSLSGETQRVLASLDNRLLGGFTPRSDVLMLLDPELGPVPLEVLPSLASVAFVTAPSLSTHLRCRAIDRRPRDDALVVAGPSLKHAEREAQQVASNLAQACVLSGPNATVEAVISGLNSSVLHIACHGRLRPDNPMFSAFELADGRLALHEFQYADPAPVLVTAGSCDLGGSARSASSSAHNIDTVLLTMGTRAVVSSSQLIPDSGTADLMIELYRMMAGGASAAEALRDLRLLDGFDVVAAAFRIVGADARLEN